MIAYGTSEGHTARIAKCIAQVIRGEGHQAFPVEITPSYAPPPNGCDGMIIGASVHRGRHQAGIRDFVRKHRRTLERMPTAFFSVSLAAAGIPPAQAEAEGYVQQFLRDTGWRPGRVECFAGALLYTRYGFITRWIMRRIAMAKGSPDTDTSRDYVYTDWDGVKRFAREFLASSLPRTRALTPETAP
jgi:menaquinone-dependent protoporphyrinogen oxidase